MILLSVSQSWYSHFSEKKLFSFAFLDIQIQLHISPIATNFISSMKLWTKNFRIKKRIGGVFAGFVPCNGVLLVMKS